MIEHLPTRAIDYDEVTVFYNPDSTNAGAILSHTKSRLDRVKNRIPIHYAESSPDPGEMIEIYANNIDPKANTIVGIVGGDGSIKRVNDAKSALADEYSNTALWSIAGGSSGNLRKSTIDKKYSSRPDLAVLLGKIIGFRTMRLSVELPSGDIVSDEAITTIGLNGTHYMIDKVNSESTRTLKLRNIHIGRYATGKWLVDPPEILAGLIKAPGSFDYVNETGKTTSAFEILFINTPHVASIINSTEVSLPGPSHRIDVAKKVNLPSTLIKINGGRSPGRDLVGTEVIRPLVDVAYQIDGESRDKGNRLIIAAGSIVTISQSEESIGILQLDLAA
jgi:hypothetical protein